MAPRVNIDAVLDWAVATGRIKHDAHVSLREAFGDDPVRTLGRLLLAEPGADLDRTCPLFAAKDPKTSRAAKQTWDERRAKQRASADTVTAAITNTLTELGHDAEDPALRALVRQQMLDAEERAKKAARTAARAATAEQQKLARDDSLTSQLVAYWA